MTDTDRWSARSLATCALLAAMSVLLSFIEFPLIPGVPWLEYDASAVPAVIGGFLMGPAPGVAIGTVSAIIHGILFADFSGAVMNLIVVAAYVGPAALIYRKSPTRKGQLIGLIVGSVALLVAAILGNLVITPLWLGVPLDAVIVMIPTILLPFNAAKAVLNSILSFIVFAAVRRIPEARRQGSAR